MSNSNPVLITSLDFELFWGVHDCFSFAEYCKNVLGGREAIPKLLSLFEDYGIHATWATVGFLFSESIDDARRFFPEENKKPTYENEKLSPYPLFDSIGNNEKEAPCFYASSLIHLISQCPGQEIGSHTFSHFYCREKGQTIEQFEADMKAAVAIAADKGIQMTSVVLPRNQFIPEYNKVLSELGFTAFRDEENDWIHERLHGPLLRLFRLADVYFPLTGQGGYRPLIQDGLVNLPGSRMYKPFFQLLSFFQVHVSKV